MIDLSRVRNVVGEATKLIDDLHGIELDETDALVSQSKGKMRMERAQRSQDLNLLATRLELAAALVRVEYWCARGERDPIDPDRRQ
ncbi:hypothetical protein [Nocardioides sp. URHA0032]|uniref:hypothetical protein n=1 Tax=Nocardioides sp. URHA0032 TaxID=1380388 RepID=UPI00048C9AEB|nr:hypothetical protein [Nocardioides sp. URHA0032]